MRIDIPVPYWCQYDNALYPGGTCNLTSAWMCIEHYHPGRVKNPDVLTRECLANNWDRHALEVIDRILEKYGVADNSGYAFTMDQIKAHLQTKNPVIIQGEYTPSGHIVVVRGFDTSKGVWIVNDPAGMYDLDRKKYNGYVSGKAVEYPSDWFRRTSAPDGHAWAHLLKKKAV